MGLAIKRNPDIKADLRALATGQYSGDAGALIDEAAADLIAGLSARLKGKSGAKSGVHAAAGLTGGAARKEIVSWLTQWLIEGDESPRTTRESCLPVARWSPGEVVRHTGISKSTLYRGDHAQFYSVVPIGKKNGRAYPAWQFVGEVASCLPAVLEILHGNSRMQVNTFFMSEQDALNELTPAEVLAGMPFEDRRQLAPEQIQMISLPLKTRLAKVGTLAHMEVADSE
jgi:hypothetical protein